MPAAQDPPTPPQSSSAKLDTGDSIDMASTHADSTAPANPTSPGTATNGVTPKPENSQSTKSVATTYLLMTSVLLAMFLVALDRTIISTAIPQITDEFHSVTDVGWYGSAYLLTCCAFQLLFGKVYTFFPVKTVLLLNVLLFEVASALCGAAPSSTAFIVGRALSGVGAAGIFAGTIMCIVFVVPLQHRPKIQGLFGALFGIAAITGPLIGGGFTSNVSWRWCFYINLPIGGIAMVVIFFFLQVPNRDTTKLPLAEKIVQLDLLGTALLIPGVVCLLLALQWGGQEYAWSNGRIIALLVLTGVLLIGFAAVQVLLPKISTLPPRIFKQRSVIPAFLATFCVNSGNYVFLYFLPLWFQDIQGVSSAQSGIRLLPLMVTMILGTLAGGFINSKIGYYTPLAIGGSCIMAIGAGLIMTFDPSISVGKWIGYQILYGIGLGLCFQVPNLAIQTCLPKKDVPVGLALMLFGQLIGAAIFVAVGESVFSNQLISRLSGVPGFNPSLITSGGASTLLAAVPADQRDTVLNAYNLSLRRVFLVGLVLSCLAVLGSAALEFKSVKKEGEKQAKADAEAKAGAGEKKAEEPTK